MAGKRLILHRKFRVLALSSAFLIILTFCGKNNDSPSASSISPIGVSPEPTTPPIVPPAACASGERRIAETGPCLSGDFQSVCAASNGIPLVGSTIKLCKIQKDLLFQSYSNPFFTFSTFYPPAYVTAFGGYFPRLSKSSPNSPFAYQTGISIKKGDFMDYEGEGDWGGFGDYSFFGLKNSFFSSCSKITLDGKKADDTPQNLPEFQELPAGLVASDGMETFLLGYNLKKKVIQNDGHLRIGLNAPSNVGSCATARIRFLTITHCEDETGKTYSCPNS